MAATSYINIFFFLLSAILTITTAQAKSVLYHVNKIAYEGYALSAGKQAPAVIIFHDWDGLTAYEIKRAEMLKKMGYSVFAADLFGKGVRPTKDTDRRQHTGELYKDRVKMRALVQAAVDEAKKQGMNTKNAIAMGYCFGGAAVLELARSGSNLKGFATFHGGLSTPNNQDYSKTKGKLLIMHGSADKAIKMSDFAKLADELEQYKIPHEMISYGGAQHAFTVFGGERYHKDADQKSWRSFLDFLKKQTKS
ncbi:MAG: dienelactone hydrolase family protein [Bdellovibrionota bacterium]